MSNQIHIDFPSYPNKPSQLTTSYNSYSDNYSTSTQILSILSFNLKLQTPTTEGWAPARRGFHSQLRGGGQSLHRGLSALRGPHLARAVDLGARLLSGGDVAIRSLLGYPKVHKLSVTCCKCREFYRTYHPVNST